MTSTNSDTAHGRTVYRRLLAYLAGYWRIFAVSVFAMLVVAATGPIFAALIKPLINEGFVAKNLNAMVWMPFAIVGLFLLRGVFNFINEYSTAYLSGHLVQRLRQEMFTKILRLPAGFYHEHPSGRVISRVLNDANLITDAGFGVITVLAKDGVAVLGLLAWLLYLDWKLTLITFVTIPVVALCIRVVSRRLRKLSRENQHHLGQMTQVLSENIDGVRVVKIYGGQDYENARFRHSTLSVRHNLVKQTAANSANTAITQLMVAVALSLIIYFAATRAHSQTFSAGDFMSFLTAMIMMFDPIKRITGIMQSLQRGMAAAESVFGFLDRPEENDGGTHRPDARVRGQIRFEQLTFRYPQVEKDSLSDINLTIEPGQMVALVGASGCGKTTAVNLIPRFFDATSGTLYLDGIDTRDYALDALRREMALVSQDVVLFNDSIARNVAYGECADADEERIIDALKAANAWQFVAALPEGIHTLIGENGAKLSGGQRQRLAIARALLKNAPVLMLDEATSALDTESEKLVQAALDTLMKNRTTIVIAHRLSTVEHADLIVVMHEGRIVERGRHRELLDKGGRYAALYTMQFGESSSDD